MHPCKVHRRSVAEMSIGGAYGHFQFVGVICQPLHTVTFIQHSTSHILRSKVLSAAQISG